MGLPRISTNAMRKAAISVFPRHDAAANYFGAPPFLRARTASATSTARDKSQTARPVTWTFFVGTLGVRRGK